MPNPLRSIPAVNDLIDTPQLKRLASNVSHNVVVDGVRDFLDNLRQEVQAATADVRIPSPNELADRIADWIQQEARPPLRPVINATGILLHTGLGRAPWPKAACEEAVAIAEGYASLEVDLDSGQRSQRVVAVERLLRQLTGAEAACIVNNNAAATLLTLTALGAGKEIIVSRGQLIEIGGSYRLPDVMSSSGAQLREVGTTNKTRASDYESAIHENTAALMRVHTSNFKVVGFTEEPTLAELVALGRKYELPVIDDIGSGAVLDFEQFGVSDEPVTQLSIKEGSDLVLFSGDKLLGGPQCGIIIGRRKLVEKISKHPMMRAMRLDKVIFAALAATLRLYQDAETAKAQVPLLNLLTTSVGNLRNRAERLAPQIESIPGIAQVHVLEDEAYLGGGSLPNQRIPTCCLAIEPGDLSVDNLARQLRIGEPAVFGRVQQQQLWLDLKTVFPSQDREIVDAVRAATAPSDSSQSE